MSSRNYRDLVAWQKAMELVERVYKATGRFPREEIYGLTSQMRRSAVSVPSNIAEGQGRRSVKDFVRYLWIAIGSLCELETQIMIATRLGFMEEESGAKLLDLSSEIGRVLNG